MAADQDRQGHQDDPDRDRPDGERADDERLDEEASEPGPRRDADPETQADAGLTGGVAEADVGERVGTDDDGDRGRSG
ncbi:MAG: hypothetical protein M3N57_03300 [Actinomycetota bacterium]|nr:hypothetical protein [Actinomycetota bacterium]